MPKRVLGIRSLEFSISNELDDVTSGMMSLLDDVTSLFMSIEISDYIYVHEVVLLFFPYPGNSIENNYKQDIR